MIESTDTAIVFVSDGTTRIFPVNFPVAEAGHLLITTKAGEEAEKKLTLGVDYQVKISKNSRGYPLAAEVTLTNAAINDSRLTISRVVPLQQKTNFGDMQGYFPDAMEHAVDKLTMIDQQQQQHLQANDTAIALLENEVSMLHEEDASFAAVIVAEVQARTEADQAEATARQQAIAEEAAARKKRDDELQAAINSTSSQFSNSLATEAQARTSGDVANASAIAQEASERKSDIASLTQTKIDASVFLTFQTELASQLSGMNQRIDGKMPKAPDDGGLYVGSGENWSRLDMTIGDPFVPDADGDAVIIERPAYLPNKVWDIRPDELVLSEASLPGDSDSMFIIDAEGDAVLA